MPLDSPMLARLREARAKKELARGVVISDSKYKEAAANRMVNRVLAEQSKADSPIHVPMAEPVGFDAESHFDADALIAQFYPEDEFEPDSYGLAPPRAESGLVDQSIELDASQKAAIDILTPSQYGCLTGAAGTGKTTIVKYLIEKLIYGDESIGLKPMGVRRLADKQGPSVAIVAYTGIAAQVVKQSMPAWMHDGCKTIHSLLEFMPEYEEYEEVDGTIKKTMLFVPSRDKTRKLDHDLIIIDESSMLGLELWHQILDACKPGTKIIMIGDLNQLTPVAGQSTFAYALAACLRPDSGWDVAELTTIHRQKEAAANRVIEEAHNVLNGRSIKFDDPSKNKNWRVIGYELDMKPGKAGQQVVAICNQLRKHRVDASVDPDTSLIYDPYRDRIMTAGNGFEENDERSAVQQAPINMVLSRLIEPPTTENDMYVIDAGREEKRFTVGHRIMATVNEAPDVMDRVTNGMTGRIIDIQPNSGWTGDKRFVGPEQVVLKNRSSALDEAHRLLHAMNGGSAEDLAEFKLDSLEVKQSDTKAVREGGGPASHVVTVLFDNGATRELRTKAQVCQLVLAYATTVHKAQGSQCDTAIIVVHHTVRAQLSREWLYTAITRASKRVIILYTETGLRSAIATQRIYGRTVQEKIKRYLEFMTDGRGGINGLVRLRIDD